MTITAQRILTELGYKAWSGFNEDDMIFTSEDSAGARTELNSALRYLINLEDFPFRSKEKSFMAISGIDSYTTPEGQISSIYNKDTLDTLTFIGDSKKYNKTLTGRPTHFWIEYNNPKTKIRLYPIPEDTYNMAIVYNQFKPVKAADGTLKFEFTDENDTINMPENLEHIFMDCLVYRTMEQNNIDEQDENFAPIQQKFREYWKNFKRLANPVKVNPRILWN